MKEPSIASVKEKIQGYRKSRKFIRQAFPSEILKDINQLVKSHEKSKLKKELGITDAILNRGVKKSVSPSIIRVAPVMITEASSLSIEVSLSNGQAARLLGLASAASAADILLQLMGAARCSH